MDVLADALAVMRVGGSVSARTDVRAPWGLRFPAAVGASFHVVLHGACWLVGEGGERREPLPLASGDVVFLRNGAAHALVDDPATEPVDFAPAREIATSPIGHFRLDGPGARSRLLCGAYRLGGTRPHPLLAELPEVLHLPARPGRHGQLHAVVNLLGAELDEPRPGRDGVVPSLVDAMLLYILRAWIEDRSEPVGWPVALCDPAIGRALEGIHGDPGWPWTVEELGARGGLSRSVFAQRFTALVGSSPLAYLTWWRMTLAGRLLRESDSPLGAIAQRVGYSSEYAFAKAFKREYGIAPGRFRRGTD
ncbi:AraC family transcriptional regulator [Streptomyces sp. DSM 44917]|uniref:AraC family transcriptional regulator n=1 Tax=Streptomyces boetiae TaxID=3075541 RepID=A0ABU2LBH0_9ACTN|nr:AraC family transcriptional regulator [Streptomyces sp. DSM 44917]MDT0308928.1 AraC family transcriptional regulator [Streptomyces sp. DSM 44917]